MTPVDLFDRNTKALKPFLRPAVAELITVFSSQSTKVLSDGAGKFVNLIYNGSPLYKPDANTYCEQRVQAFLRQPDQITFSDDIKTVTRFENLTSVVSELINDFAKTRFSYQLPEFDKVGALISFGLGSGLHLRPLVDAFPVVDLIILEPEFEFFFSSLFVIDWTELVSDIQGRNGRIVFYFEEDPVVAFEAILGALREHAFPYIEGSLLFQHDARPTLNAVRGRLIDAGPHIISYNGWFEDELIHASNHAVNAQHQDLSVLSGHRPNAMGQGGKVFVVVGSGPSLSENIELLRMHRQHFVLISAGTSLGPLLKSGIRPDFHCELENVEVVTDVLVSLKTAYDLGGITLVASTTVNPAVPALFEKTIFFIREGEGVMPLLKGPVDQLNLVGPSSVNTCFVVATHLGAGSIILVGADFGKAEDANAYSDGVVYDNLDEINANRAERGRHAVRAAGSTYGTMDWVTEGNHGGQVVSNETLTMMRHRLEVTINEFDIPVYNLGRGAKVAQASPLTNEAFGALLEKYSAGEPINVPSLLEGLNAAGELLRARPLMFRVHATLGNIKKSFEKALSAFVDDLNALSKKSDPISRDDVFEAMADLLDADPVLKPGEKPGERAVRVAVSGSFLRLFHTIRHVSVRLSGTDQAVFQRNAVAILADTMPAFQREMVERIENAIRATDARAGIAETQFGRLLRLIVAEQDPHPDDIIQGLMEGDSFRSIYLAQFVLTNELVYNVGLTKPYNLPQPWLLDVLSKLSQADALYSWFAVSVFALFRFEDEAGSLSLSVPRETEAADYRFGATRSFVNFHMSIWCLLSGDSARALFLAHRFEESGEDTSLANLLKGNCLTVLGRIDEALVCFENYDRSASGSIDFPRLDFKGLALWLSSRHQDAREYYHADGELMALGHVIFDVLEPGTLPSTALPEGVAESKAVSRIQMLVQTAVRNSRGEEKF